MKLKLIPILLTVCMLYTHTTHASQVEFSQNDVDLMARVVMSEASVLPQIGKQAIAQTIINRLRSDQFPDTISGVINQPNQYNTANNGEPNDDCYEAVMSAIESNDFPDDMYYFRTKHYHNFGVGYVSIGNTYFSTEE